MTSKNSAAARNRYLYYPDHLVPMPGPGQSLSDVFANILFEPVFQGALWGTLGEVLRPRRPVQLEDESVGSFISRRVSPQIADNIVSAVFHGIYAGDVHQLSVRSLMPLLWWYEGRYGSIVSGQLAKMRAEAQDTTRGGLQFLEAADLALLKGFKQKGGVTGKREILRSSVYSFKRGIGTLSEALENALRKSSNVRIRTDTPIRAITPHEDHSGVSVRDLKLN